MIGIPAAPTPTWMAADLEPPDPDILDVFGMIRVEVWRRRAIHDAAPVFAQVDWRPGWTKGARSYGGIEVGARNDTERASVGLAILQQHEIDEGGRVPGPVPDFESPDELRMALLTAIRQVWTTKRRRPRLPDVAGYFSRDPLLPKSNAKGLDQRIRRAGLDWKELLRDGKPPRSER